ncbi:MAG: ABC transporter permease [Desulfotomaculaceae bacterium]|nr:ABC transporter permease [Desulfotomaculaceae bacterium]
MLIRTLKNRLVLACFILIGLYVVVSLGGTLIFQCEPNSQDLFQANTGPGTAHWLGTDYLGRDLLARLIYGIRISLTIAFFATLINVTVGFLVGSVSGLLGGLADRLLMGIVDIFWCVPPFLIVVMLTVVLEPGIKNIFIALGLVLWIPTARMIRGEVRVIRNAPFIKFARLNGAGSLHIMARHILPTCIPVLLTTAAFSIPDAIMAEAFLSIVGLGVQAPNASLGVLISDGLMSLRVYPWQWLFPVLTLTVLVLCFNILGDALHKAYSSKAKGLLEHD